ncbi:nuclear RNA export factor 2-like [Nycticebus coucang]|uniref:nuclear RNA export factor 2-like n=1 Tax=Nycticebus coucang TaxID=9470 RepID=UPI00234C5F70|nr:nuclear RNA export factor 2-like [Nycticebus coucang]XP_053435028.1 nuclear RNA export factor 2-like [Nycticebus coucang]
MQEFRRKKSRNSLQGHFGERNLHCEHREHELPPSHHLEDDGNTERRDVHEDPKLRRIPCTIRRNRRGVKWHNADEIRFSVWRNRKPPERALKKNIRHRARRSWYRVTIPYERKYDKAWLLNSIQSHCSVPFTPVDFHYVKNRAQFFIQNAKTASALKDVSYKIRDEDDRKISMFVSPSGVPYSIQNKLKPEQMEHLELTLKKRYNDGQQVLDLQKLRLDPDLVGHNIDIILNRRGCMAATLQIIEKNFPELLSLNLHSNKLYRLDGLSDIIEKAPNVRILNLSKNELKSACELAKVKALKLEELWLEGNPLCSTFPDKSAYIRAIRNCFPKLLRLDGQVLPSPIIADIGIPELIKPCQDSYKGSDIIKSLVVEFLRQYYFIYDYGDRQSLLTAYHDDACFSLAIPLSRKDPASSSFCEYFKESRNMKMVKNPYLRRQLLKHTKSDIVDTLRMLPRTQHDLSSFLVDVCFQTERMLCFSVKGVFKEVEGKSQGCFRAFTRTFIFIPASNSSIYIVNDELIVRNASLKEIQSALFISVPISCSSSLLVLPQEQQKMVQAFSMHSGMKLEWSQKCLQDNEWNYSKAGEIFTLLQDKGKIPEEAFQPIP